MGTLTLYSMAWFDARHHDYRMMKFPHGRYSYPAFAHFDDDLVTSVPFAWVDALDGRYEHDFFGTEARWDRGRLHF